MAKLELQKSTSERNFRAFLWHAIFLALTQNFIDVDTIAPSMLLDAGGNSFHVGLLTTIMVGGSSFLQIAFSPFLNNRLQKKPYLITGIIIRAAALAGLGLLLLFADSSNNNNLILLMIFVLISVFSLGGSFAAISYTDILGKSILEERRKSFFTLRQILKSVGILLSAVLAAKLLTIAEYPVNYALLFILSGISLTVAMLGFTQLKEQIIPIKKIHTLSHYFKTLRYEISSNQKLKNYLLLVNSLGISITLLPFIVLYSKQNADTGSLEVGQFLIFKVVASVLTGLVIYRFAKIIRYRYLLYSIVILALLLPSLLLTSSADYNFYLYFFIGGIIFTLYKVAIEGILLEVSTNENRAIYAGISGAGNILPALFPLVGGLIIENFGYVAFFLGFMLIVSTSFYFTYKLDCRR